MKKTLSIILCFLSLQALAAPGVAQQSIAELGLGRVVFGLLGVLAVIYALAWWVKKQQGINGYFTSHMKVIGILPLGRNEKLVLVNVGEEQLLLGVSGQQINLLHKLEKPLEVEKDSSDFSKKLKEIMGKGLSQ